MTITELGAIGEFVGAIVVVVTLIFLTRQIRQSTVQQKREETISVQRGQNEIISQFMDPMIGRAYVRTADGDLAVSVEDRMVGITWVVQYLNHFQIVYDLYHDGTLSRERYEIWERFAVGMVAPKGILSWWEEEAGKLAFSQDIRELIDRKLRDSANPPTRMNEHWTHFTTEAWNDSSGRNGEPGS
jgi:hypothetical protein